MIAFQSYLAWTYGPGCGTPDWAKVVLIVYMGTMLALFGQFFVNKYLKPAPKRDGGEKKKAA